MAHVFKKLNLSTQSLIHVLNAPASFEAELGARDDVAVKRSASGRCEFNRDSGWQVLGAAGFEPVRMIAIDEGWSALRFRRVEYVKSMARTPGSAISVVGKRKARAQRAGR